MAKLHITGWHPGLQKVTAVQLLVQSTSYGLKQSKNCVDAVLDGGQSTIELEDADKAETLAAKLREIGAEVTVEP